MHYKLSVESGALKSETGNIFRRDVTMKNFVLITALLMSMTPVAMAGTIVKYDFKRFTADTESRQLRSIEVTLDDARNMKIKETVNADATDSEHSDHVREVSMKLGNDVYSTLAGDLEVLANAQITKTHSDVVCSLLPNPEAINYLYVVSEYDYETNRFSGSMRLVLSPTGCWIPDHTFPKEDYARENANALEMAFEVLALQALSQE
jgi:hypothetical protein